MSRRFTLYVVLGFFAIVGLWYFLLWSPATQDLADAEDRGSAATTQLIALNAELNELIIAEGDRPALQSELEALRAGVPATPDEAEILLAVRAAAESSGVAFLDYSASPPVASEDGNLGEVRIEIAGNGGYFQILDFMNRLNAEYRILVVDRINLDAVSTEVDFGPPVLNWQFSLRAFVQPSAIVDVTGTTQPAGTTDTTDTTEPVTESTLPDSGGDPVDTTTTAVTETSLDETGTGDDLIQVGG